MIEEEKTETRNTTSSSTTNRVHLQSDTINLERFKPSAIYILVAWIALGLGITSYCVGLWNAEILLSEKGFYFTLILFGLFAVVALQKSVRDKIEGVPVTPIFYTLGWIGTMASITLLTIGLINAEMTLSEKGFFAISYLLSLFAAVSVQKNVRDLENFNK
ncbi:inner membrane protein YiaA [Myroides odoratimimus]|uniref:inner membrane protein YiaA n=1 Tax=Myroides odoratimimus TaxID=76832 RepID=UPI003100F0B0